MEHGQRITKLESQVAQTQQQISDLTANVSTLSQDIRTMAEGTTRQIAGWAQQGRDDLRAQTNELRGMIVERDKSDQKREDNRRSQLFPLLSLIGGVGLVLLGVFIDAKFGPLSVSLQADAKRIEVVENCQFDQAMKIAALEEYKRLDEQGRIVKPKP